MIHWRTVPVAPLCNFPTLSVSSVDRREEGVTLDAGYDRVYVRRIGDEQEKLIGSCEEDISLPFRGEGGSVRV